MRESAGAVTLVSICHGIPSREGGGKFQSGTTHGKKNEERGLYPRGEGEGKHFYVLCPPGSFEEGGAQGASYLWFIRLSKFASKRSFILFTYLIIIIHFLENWALKMLVSYLLNFRSLMFSGAFRSWKLQRKWTYGFKIPLLFEKIH